MPCLGAKRSVILLQLTIQTPLVLLSQKLHHLIAPETVHSQVEHVAIKEGPITGANAMLQPNAASVLTCKEVS